MSDQTDLDKFIAEIPPDKNRVDLKPGALYPCPMCGAPVILYHLAGDALGDVWSIDCLMCPYEYLNRDKDNTIRCYNLMAKLVDDKKKGLTHD